MARGAAARLPERTQDRIARPVDIDDRHNLLDAGGADKFGFHALQGIGMGGAFIAADLMLCLRQHQHAAGGKHDVVVQILAHGFVKRARLFIDRGGRILQIIRADDGGVAPGIAAAEPALFDHRHIGDSEILSQVIGGRQTVAACAHDDHIIGGFRFRRSPGPFPALMIAGGLSGDGKGGVAAHGVTSFTGGLMLHAKLARSTCFSGRHFGRKKRHRRWRGSGAIRPGPLGVSNERTAR